MTRLVKFARRSWRDRRLFAEALLWLLWSKLLVHTIPFRRLAPQLGPAKSETPSAVTPAERAHAVEVAWAIRTAALYAPLGFVCLPQAIAAKWMLRRRHIPSTLYLGVAPDQANSAALMAHAWLRVGDKIVTGENEMARHRPLVSFGDQTRTR
jgi:hypothetical protein